jgi:hypothetical protein
MSQKPPHSPRKTKRDVSTPRRDRATREEWRTRVPELQHLVEEVSPVMIEAAFARRAGDLPAQWKEIVDSMSAAVHTEANERTLGGLGDELSVEERRGYYWSFKIDRVGDMLAYLIRTVRNDLGFEDNATLASIVLLTKAVLHLQLELQDGGTPEGRSDGDENRYRVLQAIKALTPRFDDVHMQRLRALQSAEAAVKMTTIPTSEEDVADVNGVEATERSRIEDFRKYQQPVLNGVLARSWLVEVDAAFENLDPLVVLEEFGEAQAQAGGGKVDGGDGRVGPVRALARLAVMCGALGFLQKDAEDFDAAVDRARANLLMTRSRFRKALRSYPGALPSAETDEISGDVDA